MVTINLRKKEDKTWAEVAFLRYLLFFPSMEIGFYISINFVNFYDQNDHPVPRAPVLLKNSFLRLPC